MSADGRAYLGSLQAGIGPRTSVSCASVGRRSKKDRLEPFVTRVLSDNVRRLRDRKYAELQSDKQRNVALAKAADTSVSQIQRIIGLDLAAGIDLVERLALVFEVRPQDLLTPYLGVPIAEPPPLEPASPGTAIHKSPASQKFRS